MGFSGYSFAKQSDGNVPASHCPLTGRFLLSRDFGDNEPVEHFFGLAEDPTEALIDYLDLKRKPSSNEEFSLEIQYRVEMDEIEMEDKKYPEEPQFVMTDHDYLAGYTYTEAMVRRRYPEAFTCEEDAPLRITKNIFWTEEELDAETVLAKTMAESAALPCSQSGSREFRIWKQRIDGEHATYGRARQGNDKGKKCRKARLKRRVQALRQLVVRAKSYEALNA